MDSNTPSPCSAASQRVVTTQLRPLTCTTGGWPVPTASAAPLLDRPVPAAPTAPPSPSVVAQIASAATLFKMDASSASGCRAMVTWEVRVSPHACYTQTRVRCNRLHTQQARNTLTSGSLTSRTVSRWSGGGSRSRCSSWLTLSSRQPSGAPPCQCVGPATPGQQQRRRGQRQHATSSSAKVSEWAPCYSIGEQAVQALSRSAPAPCPTCRRRCSAASMASPSSMRDMVASACTSPGCAFCGHDGQQSRRPGPE